MKQYRVKKGKDGFWHIEEKRIFWHRIEKYYWEKMAYEALRNLINKEAEQMEKQRIYDEVSNQFDIKTFKR